MTYRDDRAWCPRCQRALVHQPGGGATRLWCEHCRAGLIPNDEVERLLELELPVGEPGDRQCPRCPAKLSRFTLFDTPLDRCIAHGVWFDPGEFPHVLDGGVDPRDPTMVRRLLYLLYGDPR